MRSEKRAELARLVAAKLTHSVVLRRGRALNMWVGCGYPKSGTVWLCQLLSASLELPYPRLYQAPIAMPAVIHAHWRWDPRMPPAVYIRRDGRDVLTSYYFHAVRRLSLVEQPRGYTKVHTLFTRLYGPRYDVEDVAHNLPIFIDHELRAPAITGELPWHEHVRDWWDRPNVYHVTYEDLISDTPSALSALMKQITGGADPQRARLVAEQFEFGRAAGRAQGVEDRRSFLRKGVSGDWVNHFTQDAVDAFRSASGSALVEFG